MVQRTPVRPRLDTLCYTRPVWWLVSSLLALFCWIQPASLGLQTLAECFDSQPLRATCFCDSAGEGDTLGACEVACDGAMLGACEGTALGACDGAMLGACRGPY